MVRVPVAFPNLNDFRRRPCGNPSPAFVQVHFLYTASDARFRGDTSEDPVFFACQMLSCGYRTSLLYFTSPLKLQKFQKLDDVTSSVSAGRREDSMLCVPW